MSALVTPTGVLLGAFTVGSPEWHAARAGGLGGSEIAAVLGLSPWESPFSLWHRKAGHLPPTNANNEMEWGTRLEPAILRKFADTHPELWIAPDVGTFRHVDRPWQIANPDALATPDYAQAGLDPQTWHQPGTTVVEAKFALYPDEWAAGPPAYYLAQLRWYLDTLGLPGGYLAVWFGSNAEYREYRIVADPDDAQLMRDRARKFLDTITAGQQPPIDSHVETARAIRRLHPAVEDVNVEIPAALAMHYEAACDAYAEAKTDKRLAASKILAAIGNGRAATCDGHLIATRVVYGDPDDPTIQLRPARRAATKGDTAA
jgi:putative phage-type endonuclease